MKYLRSMFLPIVTLTVVVASLGASSVSSAGSVKPDAHEETRDRVMPADQGVAAASRSQVLINGGFELPAFSIASGWGLFPDAAQGQPNSVSGWSTTETDRLIELWTGSSNPTSTPAAEGRQFVELNAYQISTLYQDVVTTPGTSLVWHLSHRGRDGTDTMALDIGKPGAVKQQQVLSDGNRAWGSYVGVYRVPRGQTVTRLALRSISSSTGQASYGNFVDDVSLTVS